MIGSIGFISGLAAGIIAAILFIRITRKIRLRSAEQEVAPEVVEIEFKRATRLGYGIAILLVQPPRRNFSEFRRWLDGQGSVFRLREYDLSLTWSDEEILLILPGADNKENYDLLRKRFDSEMIKAGWFHIPYGIALFPSNSIKLDELIESARKNLSKPEEKLAEQA